MNAQEIIDELVSGKTVSILSDDAFWFMREVERHKISCEGINMSFQGGQCVMTIESYYCSEHKYNPTRNSQKRERGRSPLLSLMFQSKS